MRPDQRSPTGAPLLEAEPHRHDVADALEADAGLVRNTVAVVVEAVAELREIDQESLDRVEVLTPDAIEALGSPVSVRVRPQRARASAGFVIEPNLLRDKAGVGGFDPQAFAAPPDASLLDRVVDFDRERSRESEIDREGSAPRVARAS